MAAPARLALKQVKPILSLNHTEARRRVISLYKSWYRQIPLILINYNISKSETECKEKLRESFMRHKNVTDIRVIDVLLLKGSIELVEVCNMWKQTGSLMQHWEDTHVKKPEDFMSKFLNGNND